MRMARAEFFQQFTDKIIADLDCGVRPWEKPWTANGGSPSVALPRRHNGASYHGVNVLLLWSAAVSLGYTSATWMTFKQALALGGRVRKGERGTAIIYAERITKLEKSEGSDNEETERSFLLTRSYTVFNTDQIDGLPGKYSSKPLPLLEPVELIGNAERFFGATGAEVRHGGNRAFYSPDADFIQLPFPQQFKDIQSYTSTKAHEFIHWTRHQTRLDRDLGRKKWGDQGYAREELVAEIGSAFLCGILGITLEVREDHSAYIAEWLDVLKGDRRAIFSAAAHAQEAVDFLQKLQPCQAQPLIENAA